MGSELTKPAMSEFLIDHHVHAHGTMLEGWAMLDPKKMLPMMVIFELMESIPEPKAENTITMVVDTVATFLDDEVFHHPDATVVVVHEGTLEDETSVDAPDVTTFVHSM